MSWNIESARELYGVSRWGNGYFDINEDGHACVQLRDGEKTASVSLQHIIEGLAERGSAMPQLLRFRDLLDRRIEHLNESFNAAIQESNYQGSYRGVYPIKVNQQQQVIEEITDFGRKYHYGLEAGSKPELIAALAYMHDPSAYVICNGYKDDEFIDLALRAKQMGLRVILVLEMPSELPAIIARSKALGIKPDLGIRFRLSTKSEGHWAESGGDRSVFGLNSPQLIDAVDLLREEDLLDCLKLFHYHQGSQLPNIRAIREAATEAVRVFVNLAQEGAAMEILDMGGGLAVDYDGSHTNFSSSCNYTLHEYATNLIEVVQKHCDAAGIPHPTLVTESGRAVVAYYSVLVFNILDVTRFAIPEEPEAPKEDAHDMTKGLWEVRNRIGNSDLQECFNDALFYRDQVRELFRHGVLGLRERACAEKIYWHLCTRIAVEAQKLEHIPEDLQHLESNLIDFYYANFSVFQSLPDSWAIDQLFPIMPIHKLDQEPTHRAILADITCDCDGKVDRFIDREDIATFLPVHDRQPNEEYNIGAFLVGAYQETLGDLHNLLGDPHVVSIGIEDGKVTYTHEVEGDTVADVLSYVEYDPKELEKRFRSFAERAVREGTISAAQRREIMEAYRAGLAGYTYYES
ncbi:biosynthetic arginine decarboxylase [Rubritalea halochordaticola]|uniref:Biosynthetic arginine decarboxylase n=1 Tax=Rubritalea halochordaticola TaxID=714537 RepID=A0ABP9V7K9_9BACT